jgi:hypothetical protein
MVSLIEFGAWTLVALGNTVFVPALAVKRPDPECQPAATQKRSPERNAVDISRTKVHAKFS